MMAHWWVPNLEETFSECLTWDRKGHWPWKALKFSVFITILIIKGPNWTNLRYQQGGFITLAGIQTKTLKRERERDFMPDTHVSVIISTNRPRRQSCLSLGGSQSATKVYHCDWLPSKVRQDWRRGRFLHTWYFFMYGNLFLVYSRYALIFKFQKSKIQILQKK